jgi:hypothetical protein
MAPITIKQQLGRRMITAGNGVETAGLRIRPKVDVPAPPSSLATVPGRGYLCFAGVTIESIQRINAFVMTTSIARKRFESTNRCRQPVFIERPMTKHHVATTTKMAHDSPSPTAPIVCQRSRPEGWKWRSNAVIASRVQQVSPVVIGLRMEWREFQQRFGTTGFHVDELSAEWACRGGGRQT